MSYGWLPHIPTSPTVIEGVYLDKGSTKTRSEEYTWAAERVPWGSYVLDAASGYVVDWHILPQILDKLNCRIEAVDMNPATLLMPTPQSVVRKVMDITDLKYPDRTFDVVTCISTVEHMSAEAREKFVIEAKRVLKPAGALLVTADNYPGISPEYLSELFDPHFLVGEYEHTDNGDFPRGKRVAFLHAFRK
jgi:SAM-dependent methyltransferase